MFRLIRLFLTLSFLVLVGVCAYIAWILLTPVTAANVKSRLSQGCTAGYYAQYLNSKKRRRLPLEKSNEICNCLADEHLKTFGAEQGAHLADLGRRLVLEVIAGYFRGDQLQSIRRTPESRELARHMPIFYQMVRTCGVSENR